MEEVTCLQQNAARGADRTEQLIQLTERQKAAILLIQESCCYRGEVKLFDSNYELIYSMAETENPKAVIAVDKRLLPTRPIQMTEFTDQCMATMCMRIGGKPIIFASIYMNGLDENRREIPIDPDLEKLNRLIDRAEQDGAGLIIGTDANAHSPSWGGIADDKRGRNLTDFIEPQHLVLHNDPKQGATFVNYKEIRGRLTFGHSYIDLTMSRDLSQRHLTEWKCHRDSFTLDHKLISFNGQLGRDRPRAARPFPAARRGERPKDQGEKNREKRPSTEAGEGRTESCNSV